MHGLVLDLAQKNFEVFDGDAVACAGWRNSGKIGIGELQFRHARAHPRRQKCRASCRGRNWQSSGGPYTLAVPLARRDGSLFFASGNFPGHSFWRFGRCFLKSGCVFFACFHVSEHCAHRIGFLQLHADFVDLAFARRSHAHDRLVCLDVDDFLIDRDFFARLHFDIDNGCFGNRFA